MEFITTKNQDSLDTAPVRERFVFSAATMSTVNNALARHATEHFSPDDLKHLPAAYHPYESRRFIPDYTDDDNPSIIRGEN
jgi:hypothetical protein